MSLLPYNSYFYSPFPHGLFDSAEVQRLQRELGVLSEGKDGAFNYKCNVHGFKPNEIEVHHQGDNLVITGHQKHTGQNESYERTLKRVIRLPPDVHHESVRINVNEKGELTVEADKKAIDQPPRRQIPITYKESHKQ